MHKQLILGFASLALMCGGLASAQEDITTNIVWAKRDLNADLFPDDTDNYYYIKGRITSPNFATNGAPGAWTEIYMQDLADNVGIQIRSPNRHLDDATFSTGKEVEVYGQIAQTNGLRYIRLEFASDATITDPTPVPVPPVERTLDQLLADPEGHEGTFVSVTGLVVRSGSFPAWKSGGTIVVSNGLKQLNVYIDADRDLDGQLGPTNTFDLQGIFTQYDTSAPYDGGYQIMPRSYRDVLQTPYLGQQPPETYVVNSTPISTAPGRAVHIDIIGRDRNAEDTLTLTAPVKPAAATFTTPADRLGAFDWTPAAGDAGTTTTVVFEVSDGTATATTEVQIVVLDEVLANVVLNEVHWDPHATEGDANGDGTVQTTALDEFVELVNNNTGDVAIAGWLLRLGTNTLFTFPAGAVLTGQTAAVVFGGGTPVGTFGGASVYAPAASWDGLANTPAGREVNLLTDTGLQVFSHYYGQFGNPDQSMTRVPDITGNFFLHQTNGLAARYSPGTKRDGSAFGGAGVTNTAPQIAPVSDRFVVVGAALSVTVTATDVENNAIAWSVSNAPAMLTLADLGNGMAVLTYTGQVADAGQAFDVALYAFDGVESGVSAFRLDVVGAGDAALVINEYLVDPTATGVEVDANGDGVVDVNGAQDEFVEIVNTGAVPVEVTGYMLHDGSSQRHIFSALTLPAGGAVVVFGGGSLASFAHPPAQLASSGGLSLGNSSDAIVLYNAASALVARVDYTNFYPGASSQRTPELTGAFSNHYTVTAFTLRASPGTRMDGSAFLTDQPPQIATVGDRSVAAGQELVFAVNATEPDGDTISMVASNLPPGASFVSTPAAGAASGTLTFTSLVSQVGMTFDVEFYATDIHGTDREVVRITVTDSSTPLIFDFEDGWQGWTNFSRASNKDWTRFAGAGSGAESTAAKLEANGFGGDVASDDWALSPKLDLSAMANPRATFWVKRDFTGPDLVVAWSGNYNAGDPMGGASWSSNVITATSIWGEITQNLTGMAGQGAVTLAFRYQSAGVASGEAARWSVDQIEIAEYDASAPALAITNPAAATLAVPNATASYSLAGTANANVVGLLAWTNSLTGASGTVAAGAEWTIAGIALELGANAITVVGTNEAGAAAVALVTITRNAGGGGGGALIISQYYEGASSNKWIELYNAGASAVDLATEGYRLGVWANAARESWKTDTAPIAIALTGTIPAGGVYLVAHSSAALPAYALPANVSSGSLTHNGDDSIGLYTGATYSLANLKDVLGLTANTATNISYVRKVGIVTGTASDFNAADWDEFALAAVDAAAVGTPERLGFHSATELADQPPLLAFVPAGLSKTGMVGAIMAFTVTASEVSADVGQTISDLSALSLPAGASFPPANGVAPVSSIFTWTPAAAGAFAVTCTATDVDGTTTQVVTITVSDAPFLPPTVLAATGVASNQFTANWTTVFGATGYLLDVATNASFAAGGGGGGGGAITGPAVVINEFRNETTDAVELLVVSNNLNMQGMILKDYSSSGANDNGGGYTFKTHTLWSAVPAGTLIVLRKTNTSPDVDAADGILDVGLTDTTYFTTESGVFDIANDELIQIKAAGSGKAGHTGVIHTFGTDGAGAQYTSAPTPKLKATTGDTGTGESVIATTPTGSTSEYNGTSAQGDQTTGSLGAANNASNAVLITALRAGGGGGGGGAASTFVPGYEARFTAGTSLAVTGLTPLTTYYYRVRATNDSAVTGYSGVTNVTTQSDDPNPPAVAITTLPQTVPFAVSNFTLIGTANANAVGLLAWVNSLGGQGSEPVASDWVIPTAPLAVGVNVFTVTATNARGTTAAATVEIVRQSAEDSMVATNLTIMAANLTSGDFQSYEAAGIRLFQGLKPDVVAIQEFNYQSGTLRDLVDTAFGTNYAYYVESGATIPNGIVSRFPILASGEWPDPEAPNRDFAWATLDIPGSNDLHVVSVHFSTSDAGTRERQATNVRARILAAFPTNDYVVLAGDLNTSARNEAAVQTLATAFATNRVPRDQAGVAPTSANRENPYDWVMPNPRLAALETNTVVDGRDFAHGLVYDSRVTSPYTLRPSPIQAGDSGVASMQHMPVMKTFRIPVADTPAPTYYAVIAGISDYEGTINDLDYCDNDAQDIYARLLSDPHWDATNMILLVDAAATETAIRAAITNIGARMGAGDTFLFFFSGHGTQVDDAAPLDEADGIDEALCPYNLDTQEITDDELGQWLGGLPTQRVIVWLDTCFSGGHLKAAGRKVKGVGLDRGILPGDGFTRDLVRAGVKDVNDLAAPYIASACDDDELSIEDSALQNGLFTFYLLLALDRADADLNGWVSAEEAFDDLYARVVAYESTQHPQEYDAFPGQADVVTADGGGVEPGGAVFISEYVEGSGYNKALEIYNHGDAVVDLTAAQYVVQVYANGGTTPASTIELSGALASKGVFVLALTSATSDVLAAAQQLSGSLTFNGNDAVVLRSGGASGPVLDSIGRVGENPGTAWGTEPVTTLDHTLRRKATVTAGDATVENAFDPVDEWDASAINTFDGLGTHTAGGGDIPAPGLVITTTNMSVPFATASADIAGTATVHAVGLIAWSNSLGGAGTIAAATAWTIPGVPLAVGDNVITVTATNATGAIAQAAVTLTRAPDPAGDADGDGLPNGWEETHFGGVTNAQADANADDDPFTNAEEYEADTDPNDPTSFLLILDAMPGGETSVNSSTGRLYTLFGTTNLMNPAAWGPVSDERWGDGGPMTLTDTNPVEGAKSYRVRVRAP